VKSFIAELISMIIQGLGEILSGYLWSLASPILREHPAILVALPGLAEDRGAVYGSLAAKYSTMLYTGEITNAKELLSSKVTHVAIILGVIGGIYVIALTSLVGNPLDAFLYFLVSRGFTLAILIPFTAYASVLAFFKGLNVDLIVVSITSIIADITSAFSIFLTFSIIAIVPIIIMLYATFLSLKKIAANEFKRYKEYLISTILASTISTVAGLILATNDVQSNPALLLVTPITMALNGSASMNFTSWLGTMLALGDIDPRSKLIDPKIILMIIRITITAILALMVVELPVVFTLHCSTKPVIWSLVSTIILRLSTPYLSLFITYVSYLRGWDPDLITIPLLSSLNDVITSQILVWIASTL